MKKTIFLLLTLCLTACAAVAPEAATPAPDSLDLSDGGLVEVAQLAEYSGLKSLDLRGNEIAAEDYASLAAALPDCEILWSVPIAGTRADSDSTALTLPGFTAADLPLLAYFPRLSRVDATGSSDYAALCAAAEKRGDVEFLWTVQLGAQTLRNDETAADCSGEALGADEIDRALAGLPALTELQLYETPLSDDEKRALTTAWPEVRFGWTVEVLPGVVADSAESLLDLRGQRVRDVDALIAKLVLLPGLSQLDMCECGPSDEDMLRIRAALPGVKVVWMIDVADFRIRTDILGFSTGVTSRFPNGGGYRTGHKGYNSIRDGDFDKLVYCTDIIALDIGHCRNITDISFIAEMPKLRYLIIAMTNASDISALAVQTELEFLEIYDNYDRKDITPLRNCKKLKHLNCSATGFTEIDTLLSLTSLERLWMTASMLTDEQLLAVREGLPKTSIMDSRDRVAGESLWRRGNWSYVDMQRIFGLRAQYQGKISPTPELSPTPEP